MQRFYFDLPCAKTLSIRDAEFFHQISHVMRVRPWDEIVIFNWDGWDYTYAISEITKKEIILTQTGKMNVTNDSIVPFHLYQATPNKYEKIESILQKWVEVGISRFVFFRSDRSQKLVISDAKKERFRAIVQEALEQCGGNWFPEISFVENIEFDRIFGERLLFHTDTGESVSLKNISQTLFPSGKLPENISLFVGPEGWFSPEEIAVAKESGVEIVHFGSRIFRTETVSSAVVFYLSQLF